MNQSSKTLLTQLGYFLLIAIGMTALCVVVTFFSASRRNDLLSAQAFSVASTRFPDSGLVSSDKTFACPEIPGLFCIKAENAQKQMVFLVCFTVNGLLGPELTVFLIPVNAKNPADVLYCGTVCVTDAETGLTDAAIHGCKKRLLSFLPIILQRGSDL